MVKKDLNASEIYRGDLGKLRARNYRNIANGLHLNHDLFKKNADNLKNGATHTISSKFIEFFDNTK